MNTNKLKKFAQAARRKLLEQVEAKLEYVLSTDSAELREKSRPVKKLQEAINSQSKDRVIEQVAYTWFNRLMALRFMDVNAYQPIGLRVITPKKGYTLPEILDEAKQGHIPADLPVSSQRIYDLLDGKLPAANPQNEAYQHLLIGACNNLHQVFPFLFERIDDYTELLLPDDLISEFSIVQDIRNGMPAEDCQEVEVIGWLYQFYISEKKDEVFASKSKVKKEDIPAATQLFTPRWIVEYMVQNTLGKLWLQNRPNSRLREHMPYFIESPSLQSDDYLQVNSVEEITLLDQACGSGHILVYAFELFSKIYEEEGYNPGEIPQLIIEKNLFGFEIDERAAQLAGFALMMKARSYHRRVFRKELKPNILCFRDLSLSDIEIKEVFDQLDINLSQELRHDLINMQQATNLGSLIFPHSNQNVLNQILEKLKSNPKPADVFLAPKYEKLKKTISHLVLLSRKYHCVVDNPPYMGGGNMNKVLADFVKVNYPASKADLMACFMESGLKMLKTQGFLGMINQHSWMFLSSYEKLRNTLVKDTFFDTLLHLGPRTFPEIGGEVVQNASFTFWNNKLVKKGSYLRLVDFEKSELKRIKTLEAIKNPSCGWFYTANQKDFEKIPGSPIGYWASSSLLKVFNNSSITKSGKPLGGLQTGDNGRFLRFSYEVNKSAMGKKWFLYHKGGSYRKWYGNIEYAVNWENNGFLIKNNKSAVVRNSRYYLKPFVGWSSLTSGNLTCRFFNGGIIMDQKGPGIFSIDGDLDKIKLIAAFLNSVVFQKIIQVVSPTLDFTAGTIARVIPYREVYDNSIIFLIQEVILISQVEWSSKETSFEFIQNKLVQINGQDLEESFDLYQQYWKNKFLQLHQNEEELNRQFIEIYGLQEELTPDVPLEDITILQEETSIENGQLVFHADEVLAQFVSYAVGCMFGRYSLDKEGLILANQGESLEDYLQKVGKTKSEVAFLPDDDNIIPILDDEWFEDDIVGRFHQFLKATFGKENFDKNLAFVEECLGKDIRKYFIRDFYTDHVRRYKKRPIYWMFSSPKGSFNVLIYMHRYTPDTLNQILNGYLREYKEKLQIHMEHLDHLIVSGSSGEQTKAAREKDKLKLVLLELQEYERDILYPLATERIPIDLDDGVLVNYNKFGQAIKPVAGLNDAKTKKKVKSFDWINTEMIR